LRDVPGRYICPVDGVEMTEAISLDKCPSEIEKNRSIADEESLTKNALSEMTVLKGHIPNGAVL